MIPVVEAGNKALSMEQKRSAYGRGVLLESFASHLDRSQDKSHGASH